jgi:hypothetical protein
VAADVASLVAVVARFLAIVGAVAGVVSIALHGHLDDIGNRLGGFRGGVHYVSLPLKHALGVDTNAHDPTIAGLMLVALVLLTGYLLLLWLWRQWDAQDVRVVFRQVTPATKPLGGRSFGVLVTALLFVTTFASFVTGYGNYPTSWNDLARNWWSALLALPVGAGTMWAVLRKADAIEHWAREQFPVPREKPPGGGREAPAPIYEPPAT